MLREKLNEIQFLGMKLKKKTNQLRKWFKKITIKRIGTKLYIKIQWKEMLKDEIEGKINKSRKWLKTKKISIKRMRIKFDEKLTKSNNQGWNQK